ncbi:MAG: AMP-binding protein, partial [bacterium]|nr:AMP-binding protein [bacterium]
MKRQEDLRDLAHSETDTIPEINTAVPSTSPAYIIYTSGTTGTPKGVVLEHRGMTNLNTKYAYNFKITDRDNIIQFANISFDASVSEIFMTLLNGASLHLLGKGIIDNYNLFQDYLCKHDITVATLPPPYVNNLEPESLQSLRMLITAGSPPNLEFMKKSSRYLEYINAFGPTESTVCCSYWSSREAGNFDTVTIGKPISNTQLYITNHRQMLQPIGVAGQLCIAGVSLARGYLNKPELTSEKFVQASRQYAVGSRQEEKQRAKKEKKQQTQQDGTAPSFPNTQYPITNNYFYLTGDLARWHSDGNIEFLGRIDHQVKIRGFRIELQEIENRLLSHPEIKEAVVLARPSGDDDNFLCAYYVVEENHHWETGILPSAFKEFLSQSLPDYMIPSFFIKLEKIPLTANGKIDRKALAKIQISSLKTQTNYTAPRNEIEKKLSAIWDELLGAQRQTIGIDDNFFEIGGHSLRATVMVSKIHKHFNVKLPLAEIFKKPFIRTLADTIAEFTQDRYVAIEPAEKKKHYNLSSAQKRLFVLQQMEPQSTTYNMPHTVPLDKETDPAKLEEIFEKLIRRHESLRTSFHMVPVEPGGEIPVQVVHDAVEFKIEKSTLTAGKQDSNVAEMRAVNEVRETFFRSFRLSKAPLLRVAVIETTHTGTPGIERYMLLDMHHIITDGASMDILTK